jgi:hypothetical protein
MVYTGCENATSLLEGSEWPCDLPCEAVVIIMCEDKVKKS